MPINRPVHYIAKCRGTVLHLCCAAGLILLFMLPASAVAESDQKPPLVLATIKPIHSLASVVTDGITTPVLLISGNSSPHLFQVKPSHIRSVRDADVIVWAGEGVERFLPSMIEKFNSDASVLTLAKADGVVLHASRNRNASDDFSADPADDENEPDYHLWLDPHNALKVVDELATRLSELDPSNAARYQSNAESFGKELNTGIIEVEKLLSEVKGVRYLVYHDSLQYFERAFGLGEAIVVAPQPQVQAGGKRLRALHKEVADTKPGCLVSEPQFKSPVLDILAEDLELQPVTLDPLAFEFTAGADLYIDWLLHTATTIATCLSGEAIKQ